MKFTANKNYEGKEIELSKVQEVFVGSKSKKTKSNRELILEILEKLNKYDELFKEHGWIK